MISGVPVKTSLKERMDLFRNAWGFEGLSGPPLEEIAGLASTRRFRKGETIFHPGEPCEAFLIVSGGRVKVSICSASGIKVTYLIAGRGEPLNLVGPFTGSPRFILAEALEDVLVTVVPRTNFLAFATKNPAVVFKIISILGCAVDSANARILDMMEKRVEQRLLKVLFTLHKKFGTPLSFTSGELAELAGTTTESILRAMGRLRRMQLISSRRGQINVLDPVRIGNLCDETPWI
jgi:CRP-like cAMP-binding protein